MRNLSKSERLLIGLCLVVVVVAVWLQMTHTQSAGTQRTLLPVAEAQRKTEVATRTIRRLRTQRGDLQKQITQMAYTEPPDQLVPLVIRDLQKIADQAGVHIHEVKPALRPKAIANGQGTSVSLEVDFRAPFQPNVIRFLYYVEDPTSKRTIDKLQVMSTDQQFRTVDVTARITVFTRAAAGTADAQGGTQNANTTTP
jgi:hypothetical protein